MKHDIELLISQALDDLALVVGDKPIQIEETRDKKFGDYASNIAMVLAKGLKMAPRDLAQDIVEHLPHSPLIDKVEIAGAGFINFFVNHHAVFKVIEQILGQGTAYGRSHYGQGKKVHMEIVSANPTGPLHVGHGRLAAVGGVCADLLAAIGYEVHREYYINDAGRQMDILALSVWLRYLELFQTLPLFPSNAYQGDYVLEIAQDLHQQAGERYVHPLEAVFKDIGITEPAAEAQESYMDNLIARAKTLLGPSDYKVVFQQGLQAVLSDIRNDLEEFGIHYQNWYSEQSLHDSGAIQASLTQLEQAGHLYQKEGATWLRTTVFGDEDDRVVIRHNGQPTYFAPDIAYHHEKFARGFDWVVDELGSDHHGYVPRLRAALKAQGDDPDKLSVIFIQFVNLYRGTEKISMSTRKGSFVTLRELRQEVGNDATRFFYIMRKSEQHLDFDMELAKSRSNENPVYYIQYAYARIQSVLRQLAEKGWEWDINTGLATLAHLNTSHEIELMQQLQRYPTIVQQAALKHEPHILCHYLRDLAHAFHTYYNAHAFLVENHELRNARLSLVQACSQVICNGLQLLNISTPETM